MRLSPTATPGGSKLSSIRVEFVPIQTFNLGLFGFDHLQLVFADDATNRFAQDNWLVIEAVQSGSFYGGTLGFIGEDGGLRLSSANGYSGEALIDEIGTPEDRGSRVIYDGLDAGTVWSNIAAFAEDIELQQYPYYVGAWPSSPTPVVNSTTAVASVLHWAGFNLASSIPFGLRYSPGGSTLLGLSEDEDITANSTFATILSGEGNDQLRGYDNSFVTERLYGGRGDDTFYWSTGDNIKHGGQPGLSYVEDGTDAVDYSGVGLVTINAVEHAVEHRIPDYIATYVGGVDRLFSIEEVRWDRSSDQIIAGPNVELIERPVVLDLLGSTSGNGDRFDMTGTDQSLIFNAVNDTTISVQTQTNAGLDAGFWVQSAEWLVGSSGNDVIYSGPTVRIVDGGNGNDLIDGRLAPFRSEQSPQGYDVELFGGDGDDIIVSGIGISYAEGGAGSDTFVLSASSLFEDKVDFIIGDADASDRLYIPYDFYQVDGGEFDDSDLLQISGAPFRIDDQMPVSYFAWHEPGSDHLRFVGMISYTMSGSDLLVHVMQGEYQEFTDPGDPDAPPFISFVGYGDTETIIRVRDWSEGELGISFPLEFDIEVFDQSGGMEDYPGYSEVVANALTSDRFLPALDARPDAHIPVEIASLIAAPTTTLNARTTANDGTITIGGDGDDTLTGGASGPYDFDGGAGNDDITGGRGGDILDGGTGDDVLRGGRGNDIYVVDSAADNVIEDADGGFDRVIASVDWQLGDFVEHLRLTGDAVTGQGNDLRNTLEGNALDNTLSGLGGNDTLVGGLGDDILDGADGSDGYIYDLGEGNDVIVDRGTGVNDRDVLILTGLDSFADITFTRDSETSADLVLRFADGGSLRLVDQLDGNGLESIALESGPTLDRNAIDVAAATAAITTNTAPVARADLIARAWQPTLTLSATALLLNDSDPDGGALAIVEILNVVGATAALDGAGNIVLTLPPYAADTSVQFQYRVSDGQGGSTIAGVDLVVLPPAATANTAPVASDDSGFDVVAGQDLSISASDLTANDLDDDGDALSIVAVANATGGTASLDANGNVVFSADAAFSGVASFDYTISDPDGATDTASVEVEVTAPPTDNAQPYVVAARMSHVSEDRGAHGRIVAFDPDGDTLTFRVSDTNAPHLGTVTVRDNGRFTYTPDADANGADSFSILVDDGNGGIVEQVFDFNIRARNDAPIAEDDFGFTAQRGETLVIDADTLLANDFDVDGDDLFILAAIGNMGRGNGSGLARVNQDGDIEFRGGRKCADTATITYIVSDGHGGTDRATITINIATDLI